MIRIDRQPGESQAEFCERCHRELENQIPETDRRNSVCLQMCRDAGLDDSSVQRFSEREFQTVRDVPVFTEHTTKDREGNLVVYDRNALAAIAERCNERIADTGDFPPITEGHTPTRDEIASGAKMPAVLGYAGNFRLGMIGNKSPRWAIFCDEYHHQEDAGKLRKLRRRSPEVWLEDRMEDRFFDPIAALGAETPRLDMGMARYGRHHDGREVQKYTAVAPASASVFVPGESGEDQRQYNANAEGIAMLGPEDVNQIVEAIMQTAPMQWVQDQMAGGAGMGDDMGGDPGMGPDPGMAPGMGMEPPPAAPPMAPPAGPEMGGAPQAPAPAPEPGPAPELDDEDKDTFSRYMAGEMDDDEFQQYAAGKRANLHSESGCGDQDMGQEAYSRDQRHAERIEKAKYAKLEQEVEELKAKNAQVEAEKRQAQRYSKLNDLRNIGVQLDPSKELDRTKNYTDEQFDTHLDCITENYSRIPLADAVPRLFTPNLRQPEDEQKKAKYAKAAQEKVFAARKINQNLTYEAALAQVKQEDQAKATA